MVMDPAPLPEVHVRYGKLRHGVIGNGRVLALIAPTSAIDWLCMPRFDSPSLFGRLLDEDRGGTFRFLSKGREIVGKARYVENTNVLVTRFDDGDAAWEVVDFAPRLLRAGGTVEVPLELIRVIRPVRGLPRITVDFSPRPDYARAAGDLVPTACGLEVRGAAAPVHLFSNLARDYIIGRQEITLRKPLFFSLCWGSREEAPVEAEVLRQLDETVLGWRMWAKTCALPTFAAGHVLRSALCLKLHAYHDTGAIIAAATTSIPEALRTERTWDYRFCWLRDAAFVVEALRRLSHLNEGEQFIGFLRDVAESGPLQPLYGIGGERDLEEHVLHHLAGFHGTGPVRIGNAAALQQQNDLTGELILCLETMLADPRLIVDSPGSFFPLVERLVEQAIDQAPRPDTGIWEFREMPRHYTFSRAMSWVAIDRGANLARRLGYDAQATRWSAVAASEREIVLARGYNAELGTFTQSLDGRHADASNLLLPTLGLLDARDPRFLSTLAVYERDLLRNGLVLRYTNPDDFGETTSAFTICSFWWAEALALAGRLDDAIKAFDHVLSFANPLGLFSEDVDPASGMLLGNFPQAYTHVGLVHAAMTISELLEARDGRVRAWT
jgi:GH15 family glucan-1,4-alpha-glucosidase